MSETEWWELEWFKFWQTHEPKQRAAPSLNAKAVYHAGVMAGLERAGWVCKEASPNQVRQFHTQEADNAYHDGRQDAHEDIQAERGRLAGREGEE